MKFGRIFLVGIACIALTAGAYAASVTVASATPGPDYTSINAAIQAVSETNDPGGPDTITILDNGPFFEGRLIVNNVGGNSFTIQASPGVRPVVVVDIPGTARDGALYIRPGNVSGQTQPDDIYISDLVIIPATGDPLTRAEAGVKVETPGVPYTGWAVTLNNILVTSNDGNNRPVSSLDGLSMAFAPGADAATFRDEGFYVASSNEGFNYQLTMTRCIAAYIDGDQGSDGIRGFLDGQDNTQSYWMIGPGCVISNVGGSALQPGGNNNCMVYVEGTQDEPNLLYGCGGDGIYISGSEANGGLATLKWTAIVGNYGRIVSDYNENGFPVQVENCTFVNNNIDEDSSQFDIELTSNRNWSLLGNVIVAGCGFVSGVSPEVNVLDVTTGGTAVFAATDSAIVLSGRYRLNTAGFDRDGFNDNTPSNVLLNGTIDADPLFASLVPSCPNFLTVRNPLYETAGPGGTPLTGAGSFDSLILTGLDESRWQNLR
jgi:hypothetical protein